MEALWELLFSFFSATFGRARKAGQLWKAVLVFAACIAIALALPPSTLPFAQGIRRPVAQNRVSICRRGEVAFLGYLQTPSTCVWAVSPTTASASRR